MKKLIGASMKILRIGLFQKFILVLILLEVFSAISYANCEQVLEKSIGWTILESKTIEGWKDPGKEKQDGFEGCDYGRIIYFLDGTGAKCSSFGFQFTYMPTAIILAKSVKFKEKSFTLYKMIVECEEYELEN